MSWDEVRRRAVQAAEARAGVVCSEIAVEAQAPGIQVEQRPGAVALTGRGLRVRMLTDPALRWLGRIGR